MKGKIMLLFFCIFISLLGLSSGRADWHDTLLMKGSVATGTWRAEEEALPLQITEAEEDGAGQNIEGRAGLPQTETNGETPEKGEQADGQGNGSSGAGSESSAGEPGTDGASSSAAGSEEGDTGSAAGDEPAKDTSSDPTSADPPASETGTQDLETPPSNDAGAADSASEGAGDGDSDGAEDGSSGPDEGDSSAESGSPADTE